MRCAPCGPLPRCETRSPGLVSRARLGVMTGEVITGTDERLATGDAVNVAARLEATAQPGEVLLGKPTLALVREAADVEPIEPLALKGKAEPVTAYRLLRVREAPEPTLRRTVRRSSHRAGSAPSRVGAGAGRPVLRARHGRRRGRCRQVPAGGGVPRGGDDDSLPRPLPALRRRHYLLARHRGGEAGSRRPRGRGRRRGHRLAARRDGGGDLGGGDRLGLPQVAGAGGDRAAGRS